MGDAEVGFAPRRIGASVDQDQARSGAGGGEKVTSGIAAQARWALVAKIATSVLGTVTTVFVARELSPTNYGTFSLVISTVAFWFIFAEFGIGLSVSKHVAQSRYRDADRNLAARFVGRGIMLQAVFSLTAALACFISAGWVAALLDNPDLAMLLRVASVILLVRPLHMLTLSVFQGFQTLHFMALAETVREVGRLLATVILLKLGLETLGAVEGRMTGFALSAVLGLAIVWRRFLRGTAWARTDDRAITRQVLHLSLPIVVILVCDFVFMEFTIPMVGFFLGAEQAGYYSLPFRITTLLHLVAHALALAVTPRLTALNQRTAGDVRVLYLRGIKSILLLYIPAMAGLITLAPELLSVIFGEKYLPSCTVMRMYAVFLLFRATGTFLALALVYLGLATVRARIQVVATLASVGLNLILIPHLGIAGAATSVLATVVPMVLIWQLIVCRRRWSCT